MAIQAQGASTETVRVPAGAVQLSGDLVLPGGALGVVLFAHGSGSSRFSSRNRFVATRLNESHLATLLIDLLTSEEERIDDRTAQLRFNIAMLAERLASTIDWLSGHGLTENLPVGLFGASTGGGAALVAAAQRPQVAAVVSRGGRPDLAGEALPRVRAPTLLIVGGADDVVIALNEKAMRQMTCTKRLAIVPGAGHLFEEPGTLEQVADLARDWFAGYLPRRSGGRER